MPATWQPSLSTAKIKKDSPTGEGLGLVGSESNELKSCKKRGGQRI